MALYKLQNDITFYDVESGLSLSNPEEVGEVTGTPTSNISAALNASRIQTATQQDLDDWLAIQKTFSSLDITGKTAITVDDLGLLSLERLNVFSSNATETITTLPVGQEGQIIQIIPADGLAVTFTTGTNICKETVADGSNCEAAIFEWRNDEWATLGSSGGGGGGGVPYTFNPSLGERQIGTTDLGAGETALYQFDLFVDQPAGAGSSFNLPLAIPDVGEIVRNEVTIRQSNSSYVFPSPDTLGTNARVQFNIDTIANNVIFSMGSFTPNISTLKIFASTFYTKTV